MATPSLPHLLWGPPEGGTRRPRVLLGCSGSVATIKVPAIAEQLEQRGAHVIVIPTRSALHFLRAAADVAVVPETLVTATAASAGVMGSNLHTKREKAREDDLVAHEMSRKTGENQSINSDGDQPCEWAVRYSDEENCSELEKDIKVNQVFGNEHIESVRTKCNNSYQTCGVENICTASHCCAMVKDCSDCEQYPINCNVELGKLPIGKTVQTQTEIAGVDCPLLRVSSDCVKNANVSLESSSNIEHGNFGPSQCLSCLKLLEVADQEGFASGSGSIVHARSPFSNKPPPHSGLLVARGEGPPQSRSDAGYDTPSPSCAWCHTQRLLPKLVIAGDALEWEGWRGRGDPVLHIELRRWADLAIIAPLSANTLAKLANGLCDNLLTCVTRAWDTSKPLLFCPAMNTHMYNHPLTGKQIAALRELGYVEVPAVSKRLMCGDVGDGAMAEVGTIVEAVWSVLQQQLLDLPKTI